jgi:3-hydroxyacyl-CoA dehydrogenase
MPAAKPNPVPSLSPWFSAVPAGAPPPRPLKAIGVVGIGKVGTGIAHWCATRGMGVILYDPEPGALTQAVGVVRDLFNAAEQRGEITHEAAHKAVGGIGISTSVDDMEFCDMVIETIVEDAATKRSRFAEFSRVLSPDAVLASGASGPGLEELFSVTSNPGRVIGLGFFAPVHTSPQIQVTIGSQTARLTAERVLHFVATLGKTPVVQGEARPQG